ncbi:MAG: TraB/GumN family protein [Ruminococcus sp.]|uniref:TraB/GumN family protein n=1 Tax=Ruminococcus sp. TaxID=41978 RepID=UPI0025DC6CA7|nr:TraB/GumN family protein [Ruminococcus sp.]MBQ9541939.1 TraB/GumN family protein [Ruminococcus sp.]MBR0529345.1 TraB/GumN family protein [Ruminococcus sp.]
MEKKVLAAVLAIIMSVSCASCGKTESDSSAAGESSAVSSDTAESSEESTEEVPETTAEETQVIGEPTSEETVGSPVPTNPYGETVDITKYIKNTEIDPPLWKVTDPESGNSMYLLGTIHVLPNNVSEYPADLMDIYNSVDSIAVEYDVSALQNDVNAQMDYVNGMVYSDGSTVKDHISEESYNKAKDYFTSIGVYVDMLDQYTAGYWINQLTSIMMLRLENMEMTGTDTYFIGKAQEDGKEVISIEELSMQTGALNAFSDEYADYLIGEAVDDMDDIEGFAEDYAELYELWAEGSGDILLDMDMDIDELPEDLKDDHEEYLKTMVDDRNKYMADKASEYIKEGKNCLFMVGAGHYSGDNGVDNLLEGMGFTVEKIV